MDDRGPYRVGCVNAVVPEFAFNGRYRVLSGGEWFQNGWLDFKCSGVACDGNYKTMGCGFTTNTVTYANSSHNLAIALTRVTGKREPADPGFDDRMRQAQRDYIAQNTVFFEQLSSLYAPYFDDYTTAMDEAQAHYADPHEKRNLRIQGFGEIVEGKWCLVTSCALVRTLYKVKTAEFGKDRKKPRAIGDMGVVASLLGFRITHFLKVAQSSEEVDILGGRARFVKSPKPSELHSAFDQLIDPDGADRKSTRLNSSH